jgi:carbonic anhydrase
MPLEDYLTKLEQASVVQTLANLVTFPCVRILAERGKLALHGAYFGVATGQLSVWDAASRTFVPVAADEHARVFASPRF